MGVFVKGNRWYIDYYENGRRKREVVGHKDKITRTIAEKALRSRMGEIVQGKFNIEQTRKPVPFEKLCDTYLEWANVNHKCDSRDKDIVKILLKFFRGKSLSQITAWDIERYKKERKEQGRKPGTINRELTVLKRMFNLGIEWNMTTSNPVKGVKFMKVPEGSYHIVIDEEFEKIYQNSKPRLRPIVLCGFSTGMRLGEIRKLKWEDVDLNSGYILVRETKNNESRGIPLADTLKETIIFNSPALQF